MKWTDTAILEALAGAACDGIVSSSDVGMTVTAMARRRFGSFSEACEKAGLVAKSQRVKHATCRAEGCGKPPRSGFAKYCETHYYRLRRNGSLERKTEEWPHDYCAFCGKATNRLKYCEPRCAARHRRGDSTHRDCQVCGKSFEPNNNGRDVYVCGDTCRIERERQRRERYKAKDPQRYKTRIRTAEYKRKARKKAVKHEPINRDYVFRRDNHKCQICKEPLNMNLKWPHPGFATIDHIVPLSKGGPHTLDNVQAAHLRCNCKKGNRSAGDQALLFG